MIKWLFVGTMRRDELSGDLSCVQFMFSFNPATQLSVCILLRMFRGKKSPVASVACCFYLHATSGQVPASSDCGKNPCVHNLHVTKEMENICADLISVSRLAKFTHTCNSV